MAISPTKPAAYSQPNISPYTAIDSSMVATAGRSLPSLSAPKRSARSFSTPSGLPGGARFQHALDADEETGNRDRDHLGELDGHRGKYCQQPELLGGHARDQRREPVGGDLVGRGVEVAVALAGVEAHRIQQRVRCCLVASDGRGAGDEIERHVALAAE